MGSIPNHLGSIGIHPKFVPSQTPTIHPYGFGRHFFSSVPKTNLISNIHKTRYKTTTLLPTPLPYAFKDTRTYQQDFMNLRVYNATYSDIHIFSVFEQATELLILPLFSISLLVIGSCCVDKFVCPYK